MNATSVSEQQALLLVDIIDLKWLLAGEGYRVHVERMLEDRAYARSCLALALASSSEAVRAVAARLLRHLPACGA